MYVYWLICRLAPEQGDVLKQKIENLIVDGDGKNSNALAKQRQELFKNVWRQRKYTNRTLLSAIIYVLVTTEKKPDLALQSTSYSCHPVIRTRKCMTGDGRNSEGCCMMFIDEHGRVYNNWEHYVQKNALPKGIMVAPTQGVYTFGGIDGDEVQLMVNWTPSTRIKQKILNAGDGLATVGGLVATVPVAATLAVPVGGSVLVAATVVAVSTAAYSAVRSAGRLIDRRSHSQTNSLRNREARSSWLGVAGGVVGLGATGATKALTTISSRASVVSQLAVKGINVSSIVLSGTGVVNGLYDVYLKISDDGALSSYDVLQVASSLLIFTHSVNNLRIASKVTNAPSLRRAVRQQTRKSFHRISQESAKLHSKHIGQKFDIVRTLNDIPLKETLLSLHTLHAHLVQGASVVRAANAAGMLPSFLTFGAGGEMRLDPEKLATQFGGKFVEHISNFGSFVDVVDGMTKYYSDKAGQKLMEMTRNFVEQSIDSIDRNLNTFVSTELVLYRVLMHCVEKYQNCTEDVLESSRQQVLGVVGKYFESLQPQPGEEQSSQKRKCAICHGTYYISDL